MMLDLLVALLLIASGGLALVGALGLWRLDDFFLRMHPPALANTLASWAVGLASVVHFTASAGRLVLHQWIMVVLLCVTVPVTTALVARAALFRMRVRGLLPPLAAELSGDDRES